MAGGLINPSGSRTAAMGRSSVAISDFWSAHNNQAGIASFTKPAIGIYYENSFLLNDLSTKCIAGIIPVKYGVFAATYSHFGYSLYSNQKMGLTYARAFGSKLRVGLQLDYIITSIGNNPASPAGRYGSKGNITFELGVQTDITDKLTIGAWVFNPFLVNLAEYDDESLPAVYRIGIGWHISDVFLSTIEAEKNTAIDPIVIRGGLEYIVNNRFFFRTGFSTNKEIFSFGTGFMIKGFALNISAVMHESMGFSPQSSLIYQF